MVEPLSYIINSSQCSMTGVTKALVCAILFVGWYIKKRTLAAFRKSNHVAAAGFLSRYLSPP